VTHARVRGQGTQALRLVLGFARKSIRFGFHERSVPSLEGGSCARGSLTGSGSCRRPPLGSASGRRGIFLAVNLAVAAS